MSFDLSLSQLHGMIWSMEYVKRWIVEISYKRYAIIDDPEELEGWEDQVLEVKVPASIAEMLDATMRAYYNVQTYLGAQWEISGKRAAAEQSLRAKAETNTLFHNILVEQGLIPEETGGEGFDPPNNIDI